MRQAFANLRRGRPGLVPPPRADAASINDYCTPQQKAGVDAALAIAAVGAPDTVRAWRSSWSGTAPTSCC